MLRVNLILIAFCLSSLTEPEYRLPVNTRDRSVLNTLVLTEIGDFGLVRKDRTGIPAHYHTGIDIKRPSKNYQDEPIFPTSEGIVISKRMDGPYAVLIIEHENEQKFWTVYEHIAGIEVDLYERVNPDSPIARFMNISELDKYGWQFDHIHFEILKLAPFKVKRKNSLPDRLFASNTLGCLTKDDLNKYFCNPLNFFAEELD